MASTTCPTPTWAPTAPPTLTGHGSTPLGADTIITLLTTAPGDSTQVVVTRGPGSPPPKPLTPPWPAPASTALRGTHQVIQTKRIHND